MKTDIEENGVVLKAHGGDRAANLDAIADAVNKMTNWVDGDGRPPQPISLTGKEVHQLNGWMEQLRIIAEEIRRTKALIDACGMTITLADKSATP